MHKAKVRAMSLLECICCPRHKHRAAVAWDDLEVPSVQSYAFLLERSALIACHLRHLQAGLPLCQKGRAIVGLYGSSNPEVLAALLGILAVPAAYIPVDLSQPAWTQRETLKRLGVCFILIHESLLEVGSVCHFVSRVGRFICACCMKCSHTQH